MKFAYAAKPQAINSKKERKKSADERRDSDLKGEVPIFMKVSWKKRIHIVCSFTVYYNGMIKQECRVLKLSQFPAYNNHRQKNVLAKEFEL